MQTSLPVALSAQLAMEKRLDTLADNIANSRTAGFRATEVKFESYLSSAAKEPVAFVSKGENFISTRTGEFTQTGNALDMAVNGDAFFAVQGPNGPIYTRDGRMTLTEAGELLSMTGKPVLDVGGAPLQVNPAGGALEIARDGMISQGGVQVGGVGLFRMPEGANLSRAGNSGVVPDRAAEPVVDFAGVNVLQGFTEGSNVNPILEMTRLIEVQRAFESAANFLETSEQSLDRAVQMLGPNS
ncbi:MAG: flagellar basal-body rod protein FlgF [Rhizobiaceae bacterium]|nr:flagellar basal-body rod protein FlgF [Rhizobiaceae bacterium]